jgi:hypothetical protein
MTVNTTNGSKRITRAKRNAGTAFRGSVERPVVRHRLAQASDPAFLLGRSRLLADEPHEIPRVLDVGSMSDVSPFHFAPRPLAVPRVRRKPPRASRSPRRIDLSRCLLAAVY